MSDGEGGGFFAALFLFAVYLFYKMVKRQDTEQSFKEFKTKKKKGKKEGKPFFIKSLCRRRRLNLYRKHDNILSGKMGEKLKRHRQGMFGDWGRRKK